MNYQFFHYKQEQLEVQKRTGTVKNTSHVFQNYQQH